MNNIYKNTLIFMIVSVLAIGLTAGGCSQPAENNQFSSPDIAPEVGKYAPGFTLSNLQGEDVSLRSFRGKPVILNIWASWCGPCVEEMPLFQQIFETWADKGLIVLAVNSGERAEQVKRFIQNNGYSFPVLLDTDQSVTSNYNIRGIPATIFINRDGLIVNMRVGSFTSKAQIEELLKKIMP